MIKEFKRKIVEVFFSEEGIIPIYIGTILGIVVGMTIIPLGIIDGWFWFVLKIILPLVYCEILVFFYLPSKKDRKNIHLLVRDCYVIGVMMGVILYLLYNVIQKKF
jgi:hypothetical protein